MDPVRIARRLSRELAELSFAPPVTHVYDPVSYAFAAHRMYIERYASERCRVVFIGMNPGPWGMAQTGVPFGEVNLVRDWLGIEAKIRKPDPEHPKRPVQGFACKRSEVSGARVWGWARERFGTPKKFFRHFYVANYCPLTFMEESGKNRTPDKLPAAERDPLLAACDRALRDLIAYLSPEWVIGVGAFAETRAKGALEGVHVKIGRILHPSPASPIANRGWAPQIEKQLEQMGIEIG